MKNETKIFIAICIALVLFVGGLCTGLAVRKAIDRKRIAEYISRLADVEGQLQSEIAKANTIRAELDNLGTELEEVQRRNEQRISGFISEISGYKETIRQLISGYGSDSEIISRIEGKLGSAIEKVRHLRAPE